jgi:hypothetical protein
MVVAGCVTSRLNAAPQAKLDVPPDFAHSFSVQQFQKGEDVLHIDWMETPAQAALTRYKGYWYSDASHPNTDHGWAIDVFNTYSQKVAEAYEHAKDGYAADLDELMDFLVIPRAQSLFENPRRALSYLFARFERKSFRWGHAVSFLSQGTQDTSMHTPENGHLWYEVYGVSKDRLHTVVARVEVGHPKLETGGEDVRGVAERDPEFKRKFDDAWNRNDVPLISKLRQEAAVREKAELKNHPHTKLVESCKPDEFEPSLTAFDRMLDTLVIR